MNDIIAMPYSNMGIDILSVTEFNSDNNDCKVHSRIGYTVALATITTFPFILFGYILMDKAQCLRKLLSRRQTCSSCK